MRILDWGHVSESALAELADDPAAREQLSPSERRHVDMCDRCLGLLEGHRRTVQLLAATWQFVTADQRATNHGIQHVHGIVSAGGVGPMRLSRPIWVVLVVLLLSALVGTGLLVGAMRPSVGLAPTVFAGPSDAASPTPKASPMPSPGPYVVDTSTWSAFTSARHGYTISYPAGWTVVPATKPWSLLDAQDSGSDYADDGFLHPDQAATRATMFVASSTAMPEGMSYEAFIEAYGGPNIAAMGIDCVPPPSEWERITVDGHEGRLVDGCGYLEAMLIVGGRVYVFSGFNRGYIGLATNRPLFDAFLSTVHLDPAAADDSPVDASPSPS